MNFASHPDSRRFFATLFISTAMTGAQLKGAQIPYFNPIPSQGGGVVVSDPTIRPMQEPGSPASIFASRPVDLRGIGQPDLILCYGIVPPASASKMPIRILRPQPDGSLADVTRQLLGNGALPGAVAPRVIVEGDFNEDGRVDLFVACQGWDANPFPGEVNVLLLSNPDGTYTDASANLPQTPDFTHDAAAGDVNGDTHLDIYVGNVSGQQSVGPYFLLGAGDGTFTKVTNVLPASITSTTEKFTACGIVDIDRDGFNDLVLGTHGDGGFLDSIVLFNDGTGDFTVRPRLVLPDGPLGRGNTVVQGVGVLDINHDGKPDLILPSSEYSTFTGLGLQILINQGGGVLADESAARLGSQAARFTYSPYQAPRFADLNGDGLTDFYFANGPVEPVPRYFIAESNGTFTAVPPSGPDALPPGFGFGAHAVSFDGTGLPDLVQMSHNGDGDVFYQSFLNRTVVPPFQHHVADIGTAPLKAPATADFAPVNAFTLEGWIHLSEVATNYSFLMGKPLDADTDPYHSFNLQLAPGNKIVFAQSDGISGHLQFLGTTAAIPVGQWTHVAVTVDATSIKIYINGILDVATFSWPNFVVAPSVPFALGLGYRSDGSTFHNPFSGYARQVRFWNVARSAGQIASAMTELLPSDTTGLVADWPLDEASGSTARDISGHGLDLTVAGGAIAASRTAIIEAQPFFSTTTTDITDGSLQNVNPVGGLIDLDRNGKLVAIEVQGGPATFPETRTRVRAYRLQSGAYVDATDAILGTVTMVAPSRTLIADFNSDGWDDILLAGSGTDAIPWPGEQSQLLLNDQQGHLVNVTATNLPAYAGAYTHDATYGDIDGDGDLDLYMGNLHVGTPGPRIYVNDGTGKFTDAPGRLPADIEDRTLSYTACLLVDINGDGRSDLVLGGWPGGTGTNNEILLNNGSGTFTRDGAPALPPKLYGMDGTVVGIKAADFNGDGRTDLLLSTTDHYFHAALQMLLRQADGSFVDATAQMGITWSPSVGEIDRSTAVMDINGDGTPDIVAHFYDAADIAMHTRILLNQGDATFVEATDILPSGPIGSPFHTGDVDGDGIVDFVNVATPWIKLLRGLKPISLLYFYDPPVITTHPADQIVLAGGSATFVAAASGTPTLSYRWQENGKDVPGATTDSLTITNVSAGDLGIYRFIATNDYGTAVSHVATLAFAAPPAITSHPASQTILGGSTVTFSVIATGAPAPAYQWKFNGADIPGATSASYTINSVAPENEGLYSVSVSNSQGSVVSNAATLTVHVLPVFTLVPGNVTHNVGTAFNWEVAATGNPAPTFQWRKDGADIPGATGPMYSVPVVSISDAGTYSVVASNIAGSIETSPWTLTVNAPPVITTHPISATVVAGSPVSFSILADGTAPLSYQWKKDGVDIGGATSATYSIAATVAGDTGDYSVVVTNSYGSATSNPAKLTVNVPPTITTQPAATSVVAGATVTFTAGASGPGPFSYQWRRNGVDIPGANQSSLTLSSVTAANAGNYTVVITNAYGSVVSNAASLTVGSDSRLVNLSTRAFAGTGDATLIVGFYIAGTGSKTLVIRGIGPRLGDFIADPVVADPSIVVYNSNQQVVASNDDWDPALAADFDVVGAFGLNAGSKDAALKLTLPTGGYTVHLVNPGATAEAMIEVYDRSKDAGTRLVNLSCRMKIVAGQIVIVGTYLEGGPANIIARNIGPGLSPYVLENERPFLLPDPMLRFYNAGGTLMGENDDWNASLATDFAAVGAFAPEAGSKDAADKLPISPGGYTVHASGNSSGGTIIVELYQAP